jgi:hypothetical protein
MQRGDRCVGAKINGRMMPLRTRLKTATRISTSRVIPVADVKLLVGKAGAYPALCA